MDKDNTCANKVGQFIANVFIGCIGACVCAAAIALTVRFIAWIF